MRVARAHLHSLRQSARKVRIVLDLIRGKPVEEAYRILAFTRKRAAETVLKLLRSAVANYNTLKLRYSLTSMRGFFED